jgi:hypothetical protein
MNGTVGALKPNLFRPWLLAHFVAFLIGGALAGGVLRALGEPYYGRMVSALDAGFIQAGSAAAAWGVLGAIVGTAQWLVLRRSLRARWWAPATAIGWGVATSLSGFAAGGSVSTIGPAQGPIPPLLTILIVHPLNVGLVGLGPWLILRREFAGTGWWPVVNFAGILLGFAVGLVVAKMVPWLTPTQFPSAQAVGLIGAVAGPIYGVVIWPFLTGLRPIGGPSTERPAR